MKIGMITDCYTPVINGVTRMVELYQRTLTELGHEVTIFTWGTKPKTQGDVIRSLGLPLGNSGYFAGWGFLPKAQKRLQEMDVVHCHHLFVSLEMARRYVSCPIIYTNHTRYDLYTVAYTPFSPTVAYNLMERVWPRFTGYADTIIAPSASIKHVMHRFGVTTPIEVIPNGVDLGMFTQATPQSTLKTDDLTLIYVGRLASEKNLIPLLTQFAKMHAQHPKLSLVLVGDGAQREQLEAHTTQLNITSQVQFLGAIPYDQIPALLAQADIFVTASVSEVHPLTVIEAMAAGLPIVALTSGAMREAVGDGGILVEQVEEMVTAVCDLINHPQKRQQLAQNAQRHSQRYDIHTTVQQTLALYTKLIASGIGNKPKETLLERIKGNLNV